MRKLIFIVAIFLALIGCVRKGVYPCQVLHDETSTKLLNTGEEALAKGDYAKAIRNFEALDAIYPFELRTKQAELDIIYVYYKNGDMSSAIVAADRYIRLYPRDLHVDYAYYMCGIVSFDLGLSWLQKLANINPASRDVSILQRSFAAFSTLVRIFPHSLYVHDALIRMQYIRNLIAQREIKIAEFYMKRHAYVAAANRASYVFQHFQGSPHAIEGLVIMVQAYRALHLPKIANSTYHLLQINYPNSSGLKYL